MKKYSYYNYIYTLEVNVKKRNSRAKYGLMYERKTSDHDLSSILNLKIQLKQQIMTTVTASFYDDKLLANIEFICFSRRKYIKSFSLRSLGIICFIYDWWHIS